MALLCQISHSYGHWHSSTILIFNSLYLLANIVYLKVSKRLDRANFPMELRTNHNLVISAMPAMTTVCLLLPDSDLSV
jgi:hypothetical protein